MNYKLFCLFITALFLMFTGAAIATTAGGVQETPQGLTQDIWQKMLTTIEQDTYRFHKKKKGQGVEAVNHVQGLGFAFTPQGLYVTPKKKGDRWHFGLSLKSYGYATDLHDVSRANKMFVRDNQIEYHHGELIEWYINEHRGLEQGFTLQKRPVGGTGSLPLELHLEPVSDFVPLLTADKKGIEFKDENGKTALIYSGLYAWDAKGRELHSRMDTDGKGIQLLVDDHEAVYPITIDPFIQVKKLLADDGGAFDRFGWSVSISGDTAMVGARTQDEGGFTTGAVYVFSRDLGGVGNWGQVTKLTVDDVEYGNGFGGSVFVSGDKVIVGAANDDDDGYQSGAAYIFSRNQGGADNWGQVVKLHADDTVKYDYFGYSVSISGDTAIVGTIGDDDHGFRSGAAYIFSRDPGTGTWGEVTKLTASDGAASDLFGGSVSISGDTAIVGSAEDDDHGYETGAAYIFSRNQGGVDNWGQVKKLLADDGDSYEYFGGSVSINGDTAIVGAREDDDNGDFSGSAYIFSRDQGGAGNWGQVKKLLAEDAATGDWFGISVCVDGDNAIVGAYEDNSNGRSSGSAFVFSRNQGGADNWGQVDKLLASDAAAYDYFGTSVSISKSTAIVGAYLNDDHGIASGSAYVYGVAAPDLSITKVGSPNPVLVGDTLTYTMQISNRGPGSATSIIVTDALPGNVAFKTALSSQGSCTEASGVVTCDLGIMASGDVATLTMEVTPTTVAPITNTATVSGNEDDPNNANNSATEVTEVGTAICSSQPKEILNYTVMDGEQVVCIATKNIQVEDFTIMSGGGASLLAPEVIFTTDQQKRASVKMGGTLTIITTP